MKDKLDKLIEKQKYLKNKSSRLGRTRGRENRRLCWNCRTAFSG